METKTQSLKTRVGTLLNSMMAALDKDDADAYWDTFEMFLRLHEEILSSSVEAAQSLGSLPENNKVRCDTGGENQ